MKTPVDDILSPSETKIVMREEFIPQKSGDAALRLPIRFGNVWKGAETPAETYSTGSNQISAIWVWHCPMVLKMGSLIADGGPDRFAVAGGQVEGRFSKKKLSRSQFPAIVFVALNDPKP
jgi:hypothetical protein